MIGALGINIKLLYTLVFGLARPWPACRDDAGADSSRFRSDGRKHPDPRFRIIVIGGSARSARVPGRDLRRGDRHVGRAFLPDLLRQILSSTAAIHRSVAAAACPR